MTLRNQRAVGATGDVEGVPNLVAGGSRRTGAPFPLLQDDSPSDTTARAVTRTRVTGILRRGNELTGILADPAPDGNRIPRYNPPMSEDYLCVTVVGRPGESEAAFRGRLTAFWSHFLRTRPADYEAVHAEATAFGAADDRVTRQYVVGADAVGVLTAELTAAGVGWEPVDADDVYTKHEASGAEWFQIPH